MTYVKILVFLLVFVLGNYLIVHFIKDDFARILSSSLILGCLFMFRGWWK